MAVRIEVVTASSPQAAGGGSRPPQDDMMICIKHKRLIDKILTLESKIKIPIRNISSLRYAEATIIQDRKRHGMSRAVGLRYGKRYIVGTFVEWEREKVTFWNIHTKNAAAEKRVLIMELRNERYNEIILEVDDCERVMEELRQVLGQEVITT